MTGLDGVMEKNDKIIHRKMKAEQEKVFSRIDELPRGRASDKITKGCLVLEGGAFRGLYTSGVLDALMTADINMQTTIGVSAGAMNGLLYSAGLIGLSGLVGLRYRHDSRYVGLKAIRKNNGIIGFDFAFRIMQKVNAHHGEQIFSPDRRLVVVATNCLTGEPMYYERDNCSNIFQAVQASASMPYISKMVTVEETPCLDGGCSMKIPYQWALDQGFAKVIVVKTRPASFRRKIKEKNNMPHRFYRSHPEFAKALAGSAERYNQQCDELERLKEEGRIFLIEPSGEVTVERFEKDMEKLGSLYIMGYEDGKKAVSALKNYLNFQ